MKFETVMSNIQLKIRFSKAMKLRQRGPFRFGTELYKHY